MTGFLLSQPQHLPAATSAALAQLGVRDVIVLGGPQAVGHGVHQALSAGSYQVSRFAGTNRYDTAALVAHATFPDGAHTAVVVSGETFPDALGAAPLARQYNAPVLLSQRDHLPAVTARALANLRIAHVVLIGGRQAVGDGVLDALVAGGYRVTRYDGADRFDTAAVVARAAFPRGSRVALVASGESFADALAAAPRFYNAPILLTRRGDLPAPTGQALAQLGVANVILLGGPRAIGDDVHAALSARYQVSRQAG
jgi:putative cell wall-binding protein